MITIVAAIARGGAIGRAGGLPWHYPEDMTHFKALTAGHAVVMGRKTWESIPAKWRPLPGRENVVVSNTLGFDEVPRKVNVRLTLNSALYSAWYATKHTEHDGKIDIIGGAQVYAAAMLRADALEITEVDVDVPDADTFFPWPSFGPVKEGFVISEREGRRRIRREVGERLLVVDDEASFEFKLVSQRKGETPELNFCRWERFQ